MKKLILLIILITTVLTLQAREFVFLTELEHGTVSPRRVIGPQKHDFNRNGRDELIMWSPMASTFAGESFLYFYEYIDDYSFNLIQTNYYVSHTWTAGIGDFDNDGLYEILGGDPDSNFIYLMEQSDSFDLPDSITWHSDSFNTFYPMMSTNKLKPDSLDRIAGIGIPGISTTTYGRGFYYYECNGDNSYYMKTFEESLETSGGFDIGDMDNNGKVDVFIELRNGFNVIKYEASDSSADTFVIIDSTEVNNISNLLILNDTDGDSKKELLTQKLNYAGGGFPSYGFDLYEDDNGDGSLDSIWATDFNVGTNNDTDTGGDIDYGDIDGDGNNEIVICGGRHFEVWKSTGNNIYEKIFEWTNPTFTTTQSHIRCFDFNKNGIDEIIYSGSGTYVGDENTFIFECRPLAKLDYSNPNDLGDKIISTLITDSVYLYSIDEIVVIIDSMKLIRENELTLIEPIYPCSIPGNDSMPIEIQIYSDTQTFITDTLIIYSDDWYGKVDTITIYSGTDAEIRIDSAIASDNRNAGTGIDYDDYVKLYFNYPIIPIDTSIIDLDVVLGLNNSHTWYDGTGNIKYISYVNNNNEMVIFLSTDTAFPTIAVGDTIEPDSISIKDERNYSYLKKPMVITGSFDPTGIDENRKQLIINRELPKELTISYEISTMNLFYFTSDNQQTELTIYDITGRKITNKIHTKQGKYKLNLSTYPKGIYFINLKTENNTISRKIIIF